MKKILCFLFLICISLPTLAAEQIKSFHSDIHIQLDGSVIVTETLHVRHEGKQIRRGIVRRLPTNSGERYQLISVKRNKQEEPSFIERRAHFYNINTGNDAFLPNPGESVFEITYQVWNVLRKYENHDELYWNVTGDNWDFPILKTSAQVYLPQDVQITAEKSFTGKTNSKNSGAYHGNGLWSSQKTLSNGEQMTIVVGFTPNIVNIASTIPISDTDKYLTVLYIIFLGYCIMIWYLKGRDPKSHAIMPQYNAPKDVSALTAYLLMNQGKWSSVGTVSALVQMVQTGFLKSKHEEEGGIGTNRHVFTFCQTGKAPSNDEEQMYLTTMRERNLIITSDQYSGDLNNLDLNLKSLSKNKNKLLYTRNNKWVWPAWGLFASLFIIPFFPSFQSLYDLLFLFLFAFIFHIRIGASLKNSLFLTIAILSVIFLITPEARDIFLSYTVILAIISIITAQTFHYIMYRPSVYGQDVIEHLKGLKMFLEATHTSSDATSLSQKQMEEMFPYALALGLEEQWEKKFKSIFGTALYNNMDNDTYRIARRHRYLRKNIQKGLIKPNTQRSSGLSGFKGSSGFGRSGRSGGGFGGGGGGGR